jgi:hypothetical protein
MSGLSMGCPYSLDTPPGLNELADKVSIKEKSIPQRPHAVIPKRSQIPPAKSEAKTGNRSKRIELGAT